MKKNKAVVMLWLCLAAMSGLPLRAENYVAQGTFNVAAGFISGLDSDILGNVYAIGLPPGANPFSLPSYWIWEYHTPDMSPLFTFNTGVNNPMAFQVEGSGTVDLLYYGSTGLVLKRFTNTGATLSQAAIAYLPTRGFTLIAAIDKVNQRVYVSQYFNTFCLDPLIGCNSVPPGTQGLINQYDFQGHLLQTFTMPGNSSWYGSCYSAWKMAVGPQGDLWVNDATCSHLLKFSPTGGAPADYPLSGLFASSLWTDPGSNIYVSQSLCTAGTCQGAVAKYSPYGVFQTGITGVSPVGFAWDNRIVYGSSGTPGTLVRLIYDAPPSVPAETGPISAVSQHLNSANLTWQASNDPDGDPVSYNIFLGPSPNNLVFVGSTTGSSFSSPGLNFGQTYYWQVIAQDSYLYIPVLPQPAPVVGFSLNFSNQPPRAFNSTGGTGLSVSRNSSVTLNWQPSVDPDGDPVTYDVYWRGPGQSPTLIGSTPDNSWSVSGLAFGSTYYWSVNARDPYGAMTAITGGEQNYCLIFQNSPPGLPSILSGAGTLGEHTLSPQAAVSWSWVSDPEGDPVNYRLYLGPSPGNLALVQDGAQTNFTLPSVQFGTTYYWQTVAYDPYGGASTTPVQSLLLQLQNNPPNPIIYSSTGVLVTRETDYPLSWRGTGDPDGDPTTYSLFLGTNPASLSPIQQGSQTSYTLSFQFGTTYYWNVTAADNFGAQTNGAIQSFLPVFKNSTPTIPVNQSQIGMVPFHGLSVSQSFFWQNSVDPDGDPFSYSLYFGTSAATPAVATSVPLGFTISNLNVNTAYYYKITATDIYGASQDAPLNWVYFQFYNNPPKGFDVTGDTGTLITRNTSATLSWTPALDPDGDFVMYRVYTGSSPAGLSPLADSAVTSLIVPLALGTTLYWKVDAFDPFGGTTTVNGGIQRLVSQFAEGLISPVVYLSSAANYAIHSASPTANFGWQPVTDTDGDTVTYHVDIRAGNSLSGFDVGQSTSLTLAVQFETTYYWRVTTSDAYGNASTGAWATAIAHFINHPPNPFGPLSGLNVDATRSSSSTISWQIAGDPDGDPIEYQFSLGTDSAGVNGGVSVVVLATNSFVLSGMTYGTTYYWSVTAIDSFGAKTPMVGGMQSYLPLFTNNPPVAVINSPTSLPNGEVVTSSPSVYFLWPVYTSPEGDAVTFTLFVGNGSPAIAYQGPNNFFSMSSLQFGVPYAYYIQVQTNQGAITQGPSGTFTLVPNSAQRDPYNYPSPFRVGQGTNFVFTALSPLDRLKVTVYSVYQQLVWQQEFGAMGAGVHQLFWDGRDLNGQAIFSGLYVAVFESGAGKQMVRTVAVR